ARRIAARSDFGALTNHNLGADRYAFVQVDDVIVDQPETARRDGAADRLRLVGAVNAVDGAAEIERAGAERVAGTAGHEARQVGLAGDHLRWRIPVGPFLPARDIQETLPLNAFAADTD